jgi:hypothetical protein
VNALAIKTPWEPSRKAIARVKNPLPAPSVCPCCGGGVGIRSHEEVYGRAYDDWPWLYACIDCDARVGMHPFTDIPLGTLADEVLREARKRCKAPFEAIYRDGRLGRSQAYQALAKRLGIPVEECHFGWFDIEMCQRAAAEAHEIYADPVGNRPQGKRPAHAWFDEGQVLGDVFERSGDTSVILEPEDLDLEWRECVLPSHVFGIGGTRERFMATLPGEREDNEQRYREVHAWMQSCGGPEAALQVSPLICFLSDGKVLLDDGWHRLGVALFEYQARSLRAVCAQGLPGLGLDA